MNIEKSNIKNSPFDKISSKLRKLLMVIGLSSVIMGAQGRQIEASESHGYFPITAENNIKSKLLSLLENDSEKTIGKKYLEIIELEVNEKNLRDIKNNIEDETEADSIKPGDTVTVLFTLIYNGEDARTGLDYDIEIKVNKNVK